MGRLPGLVRPAALLAIAAVVPVVVFAGLSAVSAYSRQQSEASSQAVAHARRLSEAVDAELADGVYVARMLAALPSVDPPLQLEAFAEAADRQQALDPRWLTILLLDPQGRRVVNARTNSRLGPAIEPESLRRVVTTRRPTVGALRRGPNQWGVPLRAPILRGGDLVGIVTLVASPQGVANAVARSGLPEDWVVTVVDSEGNVAARNRTPERFIGQPASEAARTARASGQGGIYDGQTLEGIQTVSAYWKSPQTGWSVHVGMPDSAFHAPLRRSFLYLGLGLTLSLALAGAFVLLLVRHLRIRRAEHVAAEQAHRLEALGRLTGGVAHDFNNLLMIIQGNVELLRRRSDSARDRHHIDAIGEAATRAGKLTRELLTFARGGPAERAVLDLNEAVRSFVEPIQQAVGPAVDIVVEVEPRPVWVAVDRVQMELALLNLAVNARDAMGGAGGLRIETRVIGDMAELAVTDTGPGLPPEVAARMFDPFFTTKPVGAGTGLGLTQVYGFAQQSGGHVRHDPTIRRGARFILQLPLAPAPAPAPASEGAQPFGETDFSGRRVLLLDDNAEVRAVAAHHLSEGGADVVECGSASEGLLALEEQAFDLVISDILMPGALDGLELARRLSERAPELPVLLVSGYSDRLDEAQAAGFSVVRKPFAFDDLDRAASELIGRAH